MPGPGLRVDLAIIAVTQVDAAAALLWNARCQRDRNARRLYPACRVIASCSFHVRAVREDTARHVFEALPLLEKIVFDVIAYLVDQPAMRIGDLANMWRVDNHLAAISNRRLRFIHRLRPRPEVVVDFRSHREDALK